MSSDDDSAPCTGASGEATTEASATEADSSEDDSSGAGATETRSTDAGKTATTLADWFAGHPLSARAHHVFGLVIPLVIAAVTMARLAAFTVDDSYISYRYARNFARGLGLVYNEGERIEGYTNFLWTVILGAGAFCGADPQAFGKVLGFGCGLGAVGFVYLLEAQLRPLRVAPAIAPYVVASTSVFAGYAVWGLETSLFAMLVLAGTWQFAREQERDGFPWSGLVFAAAGLTRPEAPMFLGVLMLFLPGPRLVSLRGRAAEGTPAIMLLGLGALSASLILRLSPGRPAWFGTVAWAVAAAGAVAIVAELPRRLFSAKNLMRGGLFVAIVGAHLIWRRAYYGAWVPNTLSAKTGDFRQQLLGGVDYLEKFAQHEGPPLFLALFGLGAAVAWRHRGALAVAAVVVCGTTYVALVGGDWMPLFRFIAPLVPFLALLTGVGVRVMLEARSRAIHYGLLGLALFAIVHRADAMTRDQRKIFGEEKAFWDRAAGGVATWMNERVAERGRDSVQGEIALGDIGQVGYQTDFPIVDLLGLVDPVVAALPGGYTNKIGQGYRDYFFQREPRYFILISAQNDCQHPSVPGSQSLFRDRRFRERYAVSGRVHLAQGFSWCVYERRSSIDASLPVYELDQLRRFQTDRRNFERSALP
ncbi:MAG: hypothetical protein EXR75_06330 [Myxococcales bacterium]|nr:hypothetical protein [Myxococcales bacterium]